MKILTTEKVISLYIQDFRKKKKNYVRVVQEKIKKYE